MDEDVEADVVAGLVAGADVSSDDWTVKSDMDLLFVEVVAVVSTTTVSKGKHTVGDVVGSVVEGMTPFGVNVSVGQEFVTMAETTTSAIIAGESRVADDPDEFLRWVVEVELRLVLDVGVTTLAVDGLITGELDLLNEVFVTDLGETATLNRVEVDIVDQDRGFLHAHTTEIWEITVVVGLPYDEARNVLEIKVETDFVVLEGDERESETRVTAEPELEGDVKDAGVLDTTLEIGLIKAGEFLNITDHVAVTALLIVGVSELVPDIEPDTVLFVDEGTTDRDLNVTDESVTESANPGELWWAGLIAAITASERNWLKVNHEEDTVSEITVTENRSGSLATEIRVTRKRMLDRFNGKVGVTTVHNLPEGYLGVARKVNVLSAVGDELHKSSSHVIGIILLLKKKII